MLNKRALKLKQKLAAGHFSPGIWVTLPSPVSCEIIAGIGFDWIMVDAEHNALSPDMLLQMLMAFKGSDTVPLIRIPQRSEYFVKQALDMGYEGIVFPRTDTLDDAREAVSLCKYPPLGNRGYGPWRATNYGKDENEYVETANDSVFCVIQIEHISGAEQIDDIVQVPGIDWIMVGPNDMSGSAGQFRNRENPVLIEAIRKIFSGAEAAGIPFNTGGGSIADLDAVKDMGCQWLFVGKDADYLQIGAKTALSEFTEVIKRTEDRGQRTERKDRAKYRDDCC